MAHGMIRKQHCRLDLGVPGCGPIAPFAHFESCAKASNAGYDAMLAGPGLEAVIVAKTFAVTGIAALLRRTN